MQWMGVCSYAEGEMFPFILKVASVKGNKVEATIDWPTMNDAKTKVNGTIDGCQFEFTEYEVIQGEEEVEIPVTYLGELSDTSIEGQVKETVRSPPRIELIVPIAHWSTINRSQACKQLSSWIWSKTKTRTARKQPKKTRRWRRLKPMSPINCKRTRPTRARASQSSPSR
jgi:hypothetical protein